MLELKAGENLGQLFNKSDYNRRGHEAVTGSSVIVCDYPRLLFGFHSPTLFVKLIAKGGGNFIIIKEFFGILCGNVVSQENFRNTVEVKGEFNDFLVFMETI